MIESQNGVLPQELKVTMPEDPALSEKQVLEAKS